MHLSDYHMLRKHLGAGGQQALPRKRLQPGDDADNDPAEIMHVFFHDNSLEVVVLLLQLPQRVRLGAEEGRGHPRAGTHKMIEWTQTDNGQRSMFDREREGRPCLSPSEVGRAALSGVGWGIRSPSTSSILGLREHGHKARETPTDFQKYPSRVVGGVECNSVQT